MHYLYILCIIPKLVGQISSSIWNSVIPVALFSLAIQPWKEISIKDVARSACCQRTWLFYVEKIWYNNFVNEAQLLCSRYYLSHHCNSTMYQYQESTFAIYKFFRNYKFKITQPLNHQHIYLQLYLACYIRRNTSSKDHTEVERAQKTINPFSKRMSSKRPPTYVAVFLCALN